MNGNEQAEGSTTRRRKVPWLFLTTGAAAAALFALIIWPSAPTSLAQEADVVVYKTASCGCCGKWVTHLQDAGLTVDVVTVSDTQPVRSRVGVPRELASCHTAVVGKYWVEGHVPADLVQDLITEQPEDISGIAVPGMVIGSPGMEGPNPAKYDIVALDTSGHTSVYATRQGKSAE